MDMDLEAWAELAAAIGGDSQPDGAESNIDANQRYVPSQEQPMKLVAYLRVSTDKQAEKGFGLQVQEKAVRAWAKEQDHRLVRIYRDEGVSGTNALEARTGLPDALAAIEEGRATGLLVPALDRLARDLVVQEQIIAEVRRLGGAVYSVPSAENDALRDDTNDPSRKLIRQVLGAVAEYERAMVVLRLRRGRRRKAEAGGYAYGPPPLGYRAEGGELVPVPEEMETVERIHELSEEGRSLREIAAVMEAEGRKTKRGSATWHPPTVARVLERTGELAR